MTIEANNLSVTGNGTLSDTIKRVPFLALKEKILGKSYELSIAFVPPHKARALNRAYRGKEYTPNTLSFSLDKKSGEIVLCLSAIRSQYRSFNMDMATYLTFLVIHSMLHLKGYEHGSTMERKEKHFLSLFSSQHGKTTSHRRH